MSILNHVVNKHKWIGNKTFKKCAHGKIEKRTKWLKTGSPAYEELRKLFLKPGLTRDLLQIGKSVHTTRLEVSPFSSNSTER